MNINIGLNTNSDRLRNPAGKHIGLVYRKTNSDRLRNPAGKHIGLIDRNPAERQANRQKYKE